MALPVLDGNQSATTLSSVVTGGEHIVAHSVVSLGTTAISNIATAVSGVSISISGTPSTTFGAVTGSVSILGTPTVTIPQLNRVIQSVATDGVVDATLNFVKIGGHQDGSNQTAHIVHVSAGGAMKVDASGSSVTFSTIAGTVTANVGKVGYDGGNDTNYFPIAFVDSPGGSLIQVSQDSNGGLPISGTVTVGNPVTISSLPAISGTVTIGAVGGSVTIPVRLFAEKYGGAPNENAVLQVDDDGFLLSSLQKIAAGTALPNAVHYDGSNSSVYVRPVPGSTVTARLQDASGNNLTSTSIGGVQRLNVSLASAATPGGSLPSFVNVYGGSDGSAVRTISVDSTGRQNTNVQLPRVTFIDGSGTVATANTAITVFASSSTRSYLLVQVTTGSAFVNVGATATTVNGINLTAGQGYAWETTIPQGIVSLISTTTSSRYVAKEA